MSSAGWEAVIVLGLVLVNGLFAMSELAIVSARRARLQELGGRGSRGARLALRLAEKPTEFLATVQIGISLVGVISGAYAGVTIGERLAAVLLTVPLFAPHAEGLGVGAVVVAITYLSLVIGELAPKRLALAHRESIAIRVAPMMYAISRLASPVAWFLTVSTNAVLRLMRVRPSNEPPISDEELRLLISEGTRAGVFDQLEQDIIERLLRLNDRKLMSVMRPRHTVLSLSSHDDDATVMARVVNSTHSRLPVYDGDARTVTGVLPVRRLLAARVLGQPMTLEQALDPPLFLPESVSLLDAMQTLRSHTTKMAIVVDEYGSAQGIVTLDDIVQALLGGETGDTSVGPGIRPRPEGGFLVDGGVGMEALREYFGLSPEVGFARYHTVVGLAMAELGDIPSEGDVFEWEGLTLEVLDMDGHRVDKLLVTPKPDAGP